MPTNGILYNNIVETVGRTPLVKLNRVTRGLEATVAIKCEYFNPLGSVKDRIGMSMIEAAEKDGILNEGTVIVEPTSGNTGIALAFVCAAKGYKLILTMPETMSLNAARSGDAGSPIGSPRIGGNERRHRTSGRTLKTTPTPGCRKLITPPTLRFAAKPAEEIWADTDGKVDILVAAVGTGGTITGSPKSSKNVTRISKAIAVERRFAGDFANLERPAVEAGAHKIGGWGGGLFEQSSFEHRRRSRHGFERGGVHHGTPTREEGLAGSVPGKRSPLSKSPAPGKRAN
jgi:cysteine synthase A